MKKSYVKKMRGGIICLVFTLLLCASCNFQDLSLSQTGGTTSSPLLTEQKQFSAYLDKLFQTEVTGSTINLHYTLANPKEYGIQNYPITYGDISEKDKKNNQALLENTISALNSYDYNSLSTNQKLTHDIINDYLTTQEKYANLELYDEILRPTTGIAAQLPILLAEYSFRNNKDVTDYLTLLSKTKDYFSQIIAFEERKSEAGLFMSDYAADAVIDSCDAFIKNPEENFLLSTFQKRIETVPDLPDEKKSAYIDQNHSLVQNNVISAYENLRNAIESLKGSGSNNEGLCHYPEGKNYYEYLVKINTGSNKRIADIQKMVEEQREKDLYEVHSLIVKNPALIGVSANVKLAINEPAAMLDLLQKKMTADFTPAVDSNYELNYVDASLEASTAPAFYLTAPIDNTSHNVIYINKSSNYTGMELFTTLAHEGFPGHLYQTTGSYKTTMPPIRALFNYSGYVEGWATYVEMLSYQYAGLEPDKASTLQLNQSALLSLYATLDLAIHYDGWALEDAKNFFAEYGIKDEATIQSIYELVVEEPSHYLKYYVGYLEFLELKNYAKSLYGEKFSNKAFHQAIITIGPAPFSILRNYLQDYYDTNL